MHSRTFVLVGFLGLSLAGCSSEAPNDGGAGTTTAGTASVVSSGAGTGSNVASGGSLASAGAASGDAGAMNSGAGGTMGAVGAAGASPAAAGASTAAAGAAAGGAAASTGGAAAMAMGGGAAMSGPVPGCMQMPQFEEPPGDIVHHDIQITGMADEYVAGYSRREYCTQMPSDYDSTKEYPVIFYGPGCGGDHCEGNNFTGRNDVFIVQAVTANDAKGDLLVPQNGAPGCFQAGKEGTADSPEGPYFDQVMAEVEARYCIDKSRIFAAGTSSGAWLSNYLACARGGVIRGIAADSGGLQFAHGECTPGTAVMEFPGDATNSSDQEGHEIGVAQARDLFIELNGCNTTPTQMMFGNDTCDFYGGCDSPVVWCNVGGGHQSGQGHFSSTGLDFWNSLQ